MALATLLCFSLIGAFSLVATTPIVNSNPLAILPEAQESLQTLRQVRTAHVALHGNGTIQTNCSPLPLLRVRPTIRNSYTSAPSSVVKHERGPKERTLPMQRDAEETSQQLLFTIPQVAKSLGVSRAMVYTLIARNKGLPVIRLGRSVRVSVDSLRKWIEEQEQEQRSL